MMVITDLLNHQWGTVVNLEYGIRGAGRNICAGATPISAWIEGGPHPGLH